MSRNSVEYWNKEHSRGLARLQYQYPRLAWINPMPRREWLWHPSIKPVNELIGGRMYPLTLVGLTEVIDRL